MYVVKQKSYSYFRRILIVALTVLLVSVLCVVGFAANGSSESQSEAQECYILGDMNSDGDITSRDAIHLLYHKYWPEEYPIHGSGDLNGDGTADSRDALALCYAESFPEVEEFQLKGLGETIHAYGEAILIWEETDEGYSAKCVTDCACHGAKATQDAMVSKVVKDPSCMELGKIIWTASVEGVELDPVTTTKEKTTPANGHKMVAADCDEPRHCENCNYVEGEVLGHRWGEPEITPATCKSEGKEIYTCTATGCTETMEITLKTVDHSWVAGDSEEVSVENESCTYQTAVTYTCSVDGCDETKEVRSEEYVKHSYGDAVLTKLATCMEEGERTFTCTECQDAKTETVAKNSEAHNWVVAASTEEVTTHTCANEGCEAIKTTVVVTSQQAVSTEILKNELQLTSENAQTGETVNAALSVDEDTLNALDSEKEVKVSVEKAPQEVIEALPDEQKQQLGENPVVYDFNMAYAAASEEEEDEAITEFSGEVTITLPYELEEGEDPENIAVWFIADDGSVESIPATYSNGFVTFKTSHFSYYTVTRLTPEERCATYGHLELVVKEKTKTCTEDGYHIETCPRCGMDDAEKSVTYPHTGHQYVTNKQEANCEQGGEIAKTCSDCEHEIKVTIPAKGHNMQLQEGSATATCTEDGVLIYACVNGCGKTVEEALPATGHDFELTAEEKADCTNNGHKDYECKNGCGEKFSEVTEGFTGHLYNEENAVWDYDVDANGNITNVTCTLRCAYNLENEEHWKELNKITVTSDSQGVSCTEDGTIKYTFKANYNAKTTFTKTVEVAAPALGHLPSVDWQHNDLIHYKQCSRCAEQLNQNTHVMLDGETVTEATCVDSGEISTYCVECGYTASREVPATNVHDYNEHGICGVCGKSESDCNHARVIQEEIDLSAYNVCAGTKVIWVSCECGYDREITIWEDVCEHEYSDITMEDPNGYTMNVTVATCVNCDLVSYTGGYAVYEKETCRNNYAHYTKVVVGDAVLGESYAENEFMSYTHEITEYTYVDLTMEEHGICDVTYEVQSCGCGENVQYIWVSGGCTWTIVDHTPEGDIGHCSVCGAERLETIGETVQNGCTETHTYTTIITQNGEEVYTFDTNRINIDHLYRILNAEAYNEYWVVDAQCVFCGLEEQRVHYGCQVACYYVTEYTDVSDSLCCSVIAQKECICGEGDVILEEWSVSGPGCMWNLDETGTVSTCANCGARREVSTQLLDTENSCVKIERADVTFYDVNGNEVATGYATTEIEDHNYVTEYTLLGVSCEDGVLVETSCSVCGDGDSYTNYDWHLTSDVETVDLSHLDACISSVTLQTCPCGMCTYVYTTWSGDHDCTWYYDGNTASCGNCGLMTVDNEEYIGMKDDCHPIYRHTYTLYNENTGEVLYSATYEQFNEIHDEYFVFELLEGATTCDDGYYVTRRCLNCDYEEDWGEWYGCDTRRVKRETYPVAGMCGTPVLDTYSCACGANKYYEQLWLGEECYVPDMSYNEATDRDEGICENCGVMHTFRSWAEDNEANSCSYFWIEEYTFERNGQVQAEITQEYENKQHSYNTTFTMLGDTCDDGYYAESICQQCGNTYTNYYEGCDHYIERETEILYDQVGMCGKIQYVTYGCACTEQGSSVNTVGNFVYDHDTDDGHRVYFCKYCGLEQHWRDEKYAVSGTCLFDREDSYIFYMDGQKVAEATASYQWQDHKMIHTFDMYGDTCDDGYLVTAKCYYCGYENSWEASGCGTYITDFTLLADSDVSCGRFRYVHEQSPCGKDDSWYYEWDCRFSYLGNENGWDVHECTECGLVWKERVTEEGTNTCQYFYVREIELLKDGEVISSEVIRETYYEHIPVVEEFHMNGETCADGYTVTGNCIFCHEPVIDDTVYYDCTWLPTKVHLLANEEGTCGLNAYVDGNCACGNSPFTMPAFSCRFQEINTSPDGNVSYLQCNVCGLEAVQERLADTVDGCVITQHYRYTMSMNGQVFNEIEVPFEMVSHEYVYDLEALGNTCSDGYYATGTCIHCSEETAPVKGYGCTQYLVDYHEVEHEGSCGTYMTKVLNCACGGMGNNIETLEECPCDMQMVYSEYTADGGSEYLQCSKCGIEWHLEFESGCLDETCSVGTSFSFQWIWDGEIIDEYDIDLVCAKDHKIVYDFEMLGDSVFADGCNVYAHCAECGKDMGLVTTTYNYEAYPVSYVPLSDNLYTCGGARFGYYEYAYPNGDPAGCNLSSSCSFTSTTTPGGTTIQQCSSCGLQWIGSIVEEHVTGTCKNMVTVDADYGFNYTDGSGFEVDMGSVHDTFEVIFHQGIYEFELLGEDCDDGYNGYAVCAFCDFRMQLPGQGYGHTIYPVAIYDLAAKGVCLNSNGEARAVQYSCPCERFNFSENAWGCELADESGEMIQVDERTFVQTVSAHCTNADCTTKKHTQQVIYTQPAEGSCVATMKMTYTMDFDDGTVVELCYTEEQIEHTGEITSSYTFLNGGTTCEDGVTEYQTCSYCQESTEVGTVYYCKTNQVSQSNLSDYGVNCGGYLIYSECPCGDQSYYELMENGCAMNSVQIDPFVSGTVEDGNYQTEEGDVYLQNYAYKMNCTNSDCSGCIRVCSYWVKEGCELVNYEVMQLGYDETTAECLGEFTSRLNSYDYHDPASQVTTRTLEDGSVVCTDGVHVQTYCGDCEEVFENRWYYSCDTYPTEKIDLSQYGSLCGGYLAKYECLCGKATPYYDFLDLKCDLDQVETEHFVEGTLDDVGQHSTMGWTWLESESYILTCAVTDPEICGMKIRQSRCWLQEGCYAVEYMVYQLDYDPDTNTWAKEVKLPTGNKVTFHPVEEYSRTESISDTERVDVSGYDCSVCGSFYKWTDYRSYDEELNLDYSYKTETLIVNELDNGEDTRWFETRIYDTFVGYVFLTLERSEQTNAYGNEYWAQWEYEYDFSDGCKGICYFTDSTGYSSSNELDAHITGYTETYDPAPTCGQFGRLIRTYPCFICGKITSEYEEIVEPTGHSWVWNEEHGIYECTICQMECVNDASGSIVLEDLSEELGNGTEYVVAYWNRGNIDYNLYVCVVMNDMEGDNEKHLTVNTTDDELGEYGSRVIRFNIAEAEAAAAAAVAAEGYTGDYSIRLTFAPAGITGELDYSVTFDTLKAE